MSGIKSDMRNDRVTIRTINTKLTSQKRVLITRYAPAINANPIVKPGTKVTMATRVVTYKSVLTLSLM